jgi:hypothetical protein
MAGEIEQAFASATWEFRKVKIERPPGPNTAAARRASFRARLARRDARRPLEATIRYRGGPESWWEISARGRLYRFPGWWALDDVCTVLNRPGRPPGT